MIEIKDPAHFFQLQAKFNRIPFTQSEGWYNYLKAQCKQTVFFADNLEDTNVLFWGVEDKVPFTGKKLLRVEGECYTSLNEDTFKVFFSNLKNSIYSGIEINSNNAYHIDYEIGLRRSGFVRPLGSFSCPLTIEVELDKEFNFNRNWKRNIKTAEKHNLHFVEIKNPKEEDVNSIISLFKEMADLKKLGYSLSSEPLRILLQSKEFRTFIVYNEKEEPLAARVIHVYNNHASDVIAANSNSARDCGAIFYLVQQIFELLKSEKIMSFDFGRIPPSDHATDNVYIFKNATRGNKVQYNGEWTYYKDKKTELAIFLYKWFKLKKQRY
jgi:hypothetical protein